MLSISQPTPKHNALARLAGTPFWTDFHRMPRPARIHYRQVAVNTAHWQAGRRRAR